MLFYPGWKARLTVRFEEFDSGTLKKRVPAKPTKNLSGLKDDGTKLEARPDPDQPGRFIVASKDSNHGTLVPETSSDQLTHVIGGIIPKNFDWRQNGFRVADELKLQIRWADFPFDPRTIRSIAVEFYLGTVTESEYALGVSGQTRSSTGEPLNVIPDTYRDPNGTARSNLRFTGFVDKIKTSWGDDDPVVDMECRDNTQLFLTQLAPPKLVIGGTEPLDKAIATYLTNFPQLAGMTVEYRGAPGQEAPRLEKVLAKTAFRPELGPQPSKGGGDDLLIWDYLTDVCGSLGHVIYVDGTRVVIARPSTILNGVAQARVDDPYRERNPPEGSLPERTVVYGRNLLSLEFERDFAGLETKNVEVRCYSPRRKQIMVARYPAKGARIPTGHPGDAQENDWTIVRVAGVEDQKLLDQMAEDNYNARNRTEIQAVMKTKDLTSFGGDNEDPDILDMRPGDPLMVLIDRAAPTTVVAGTADAEQANVQQLVDMGFEKSLAETYARVYRSANFQRLFRVREMSVSGDVEQGVSLEIRVANFVQVRGEVKK